MNTKNVYRRMNGNGNNIRRQQAPVGMAQPKAVSSPATLSSLLVNTSNDEKSAVESPVNKTVVNSVIGTSDLSTVCETLPVRSCRHSLVNLNENLNLTRCETVINNRFNAIVPTLKKIGTLQNEKEFVSRAQALAIKELGYELPKELLESAWISGVDMQALYASCIFTSLQNSVKQFAENLKGQTEESLDTKSFFLDCGYHCVDITPCSDGRLKGLSKYILRLPLSSLTVRSAYAGSMFNIESNIKHWESVELARIRSGEAALSNFQTHYLKVVIYHYSSSDPTHHGCAAHGSNDRLATESGLDRLCEFREAIENKFCCGASVDILLIGLDTDNDSIRVHVPDSDGELNVHRFVDNVQLYRDTLNLTADQARIKVYDAIDAASEITGWGRGEGRPREGMRKLIVNLLINNLSQIEYVSDLYGGRYPDLGHAERYISVGDGFQELQLRNIAYYAHLNTVEEGAADMDIGIKIFTGLNLSKGLPIPIAIHYKYDAKVPGSRKRTIEKCNRVKNAILNRYQDLAIQNKLVCQMSIQDRPLGSVLEIIKEESI